MHQTLFLLLVCCLLPKNPASAAEPAALEVLETDTSRYLIFRVARSEQARLQLHWLGADSKPLGGFGNLQKHLAAQGLNIEFATNAGIYERGPKPCGLTICGGIEQVPLNLADGEGNFYLKPNGVFFVDDKLGAGVMEAGEFAAAGIRPRLATQSGPLLLRRGVIHPAFNPNSTNLRQRSAVGVRSADGQILFIMTDRRHHQKRTVTFHAMATLFLDLGCQDALFLDGDISDMTVRPPAAHVFSPNTFAAMFVLVAAPEEIKSP